MYFKGNPASLAICHSTQWPPFLCTQSAISTERSVALLDPTPYSLPPGISLRTHHLPTKGQGHGEKRGHLPLLVLHTAPSSGLWKQPHHWPLCPGFAIPTHHAHTAKVILQRGKSDQETPRFNPSVCSHFLDVVSKLFFKERS